MVCCPAAWPSSRTERVWDAQKLVSVTRRADLQAEPSLRTPHGAAADAVTARASPTLVRFRSHPRGGHGVVRDEVLRSGVSRARASTRDRVGRRKFTCRCERGAIAALATISLGLCSRVGGCAWSGRLPISGSCTPRVQATNCDQFQGIRSLLAYWRLEYNHYRPHQSLDYQAPAECARRRRMESQPDPL
jgi:hypothetical protein